VDNVVRDGRLVDANGDGDVQGMRRFLEAAANEARVEGTVLQTVGVKGYDGFALLLVV
jgi:6-phosphogluconolactonase